MKIFEVLLQGLSKVCSGFTDSKRRTDGSYTIADIGLSAFSLFFMQSESFLAHQPRLEKGHGISNCQTLFGMKKIPTENYIRPMLYPVSPESLQPCFDQAIKQSGQREGLKALQRLGGRTLAALDGTEYFCSQKPGCPQCLTRKRANGKTGHCHAMLAATIVAPADRSLSVGWKDAPNVDWLGVAIADEKGKAMYDGAFVTSQPITADNAVEVAACARARWKTRK